MNCWANCSLSDCADQARQDVDRLAGGKADHQAHRLRRIGLRRSEPRDSGQRERAGGQLLELPAAKPHRIPPIAGSLPVGPKSTPFRIKAVARRCAETHRMPLLRLVANVPEMPPVIGACQMMKSSFQRDRHRCSGRHGRMRRCRSRQRRPRPLVHRDSGPRPAIDSAAAKAAIEACGYSEVSMLVRTDGTWRAKAYKGAVAVQLTVNGAGKISTRLTRPLPTGASFRSGRPKGSSAAADGTATFP